MDLNFIGRLSQRNTTESQTRPPPPPPPLPPRNDSSPTTTLSFLGRSRLLQALYSLPRRLRNRVELLSAIVPCSQEVAQNEAIDNPLGFDIESALKGIPICVASPEYCGNCNGSGGVNKDCGEALIYTRNGPEKAIVINFQCSSCRALCGVVTCTLPDKRTVLDFCYLCICDCS